ncbi:hypothetical protein [Caldithrix abyssi]|uniref:Uncharacterized protein n=1 Tax=Caldithrix abyssi DSM 13497 TaxID=880073 RepID=A0A1J1CCA0_CALAY|nr:hypothetical protein [Caldithrix abyssi]APF20166.1 hypothetical protein Cabys_3420 [Caldithrix abyssi DSM 13497]
MKTITITKKDRKQTYIRKLNQITLKGLDAKKYCGILKIEEDPLKIQKRLRDEWK